MKRETATIRREIRELDYITEQIVRYERENNIGIGEAFENYREALNWVYDALEDEPNFRKDHTEHQEFFGLIMRTGLHKKDNKEDIWKLEKRLDEYKTHGYDETELIIRYQLEAEELGKTPSARDARKSDHMPTEISYNNSFEKWSTAKWRAGHEGHEKIGTELLLEKLKDYIHNLNSEVEDIADYNIPTGNDIDESDNAPRERTFRNDEDIGGYSEALEILGFQKLREEENGKWRAKDEVKTSD